MGGSARHLAAFIVLIGTIGIALMPGAVSALDLIPLTPAPPAAAPATQPVTQTTQPVTQAAQPVIQAIQPVTQAAQPLTQGASIPPPAAVGELPGSAIGSDPAGAGHSSAADGPRNASGSGEPGGAAADTPPPPVRGQFNVAADSSVAACDSTCSPSLCPALVPSPLVVGCATASRLPALIGLGLASTGLPVMALALGLVTFATGFLVSRRRRRVERPSD